MHAHQDYTTFPFFDEEHDRVPEGNNWINQSFLLGPAYLGLSQSMNSANIKNFDQKQRDEQCCFKIDTYIEGWAKVGSWL